jgi:protein Mpv17
MFIVGFALGPAQHIFYKVIDERYPSNSLKSVSKKVIIEQVIASPVYIILFFIFCGLVEKQNFHHCAEELKKKFLHIYMVRFISDTFFFEGQG